MKGSNPFSRLDVPVMLERMRIVARAKPDGRALTASCPSPEHDDKAPSWWIRNNPGEPFHAAHKCQGCGFGGGPIALAVAVLGITEDEAREWLADLSAPPPLPMRVELEVLPVQRGARPFELPPCIKFGELAAWPAEHRDYLLSRIKDWQVERWGIGYVPSRGRGVTHHRLNGRIVFPIRDEHGRPCSYTARAVEKDARLRYLEPLAAEMPARCLFGEQHWGKATTLFVTEGVFDALAVECLLGGAEGQAVAALRGSSPHPTVLSRLALFARIVVMTDPDQAGNKACSAIKAACGRHSKVLTIALPKGSDPSKLFETEQGQAYLVQRINTMLAA